MKGLFIKDLYIIRQNLKSLLFILVVWGAVFLPRGGTFIIPMFTVVGGIYILNLFSYDKQTQWDSFMLSMPVKRKAVALERYLFSAGMTLVSGVTAVIAVAAAQLLMHGAISPDLISEIIYSWLSGIVASFFYMAIALPLTYWLGVEKARMVPAVLLGVLFLGFVMVGKNGGGEMALTEEWLSLMIGCCTAVSVLAMVISAFISVKIFEKKEF